MIKKKNRTNCLKIAKGVSQRLSGKLANDVPTKEQIRVITGPVTAPESPNVDFLKSYEHQTQLL